MKHASSTEGVGRRGRRQPPAAVPALAAMLAAGWLSACSIEMITPTAEPTLTDTATPELPLALLLPTIDEQPTKTPSPTPTGTSVPEMPPDVGQRIFFDPMDDPQNGWRLSQSGAGTVGFSGGMLLFTVNTPFTLLTSELPREIPADVYIDVTVKTLLCGEGVDTFGIIYRRTEEYSYRFAMTCRRQLRFERLLKLDMEGASDWGDTLGLLPGAPAENRIGILLRGNIFTFFVGGVEVFTGHDPMSPTGGLGFFARTEKSDNLSVGFDDLSVYALKES
jgi:hypothetical protein